MALLAALAAEAPALACSPPPAGVPRPPPSTQAEIDRAARLTLDRAGAVVEATLVWPRASFWLTGPFHSPPAMLRIERVLLGQAPAYAALPLPHSCGRDFGPVGRRGLFIFYSAGEVGPVLLEGRQREAVLRLISAGR